MSEYPKDSFNNPNLHSGARPEQIPHSGIHHDEYPVDEFNNTPLPEAMERGLVNPTPDTPAWLGQIEPTETETKSHKRLIIGGVAFLTGAAIVAGSVIGLKAAGGTPKNSAPEPDPKATSQTPEATQTPTEKAPSLTELVAAQEIKSGQTPEALAQDITARYNAWVMAGTETFTTDWNAEVAKTGDASDATRTKFADDYAKKQFTDIYGPALFGIKSGDVVDPGLQKVIDGLIGINAANLQLHWLTSSTNPADKVPYTRGLITDAPRLGSQSNNKVTLSIDFTETDNANQNRAAESYSTHGMTDPNGLKGTMAVTLTSNGATETITAMSFTDR